MTGLCPDVDIDRNILQWGACVDREFSHAVRIPREFSHAVRIYSGVQMNVSYMTGLWGSFNQGFLRSGALTIRGSNDLVLHDESVPRC